MPRPRSLALAFAMAAAITQPAWAQDPIGAIIAPEAWGVRPNPSQAMVNISKIGLDGRTRFLGGCSKALGEGLSGTFADYAGAALQRVDGDAERVLVEIRGEAWKEAFAAQLRYAAGTRSWTLARPLAPIFVASFSRGARMTVLNAERQEVFSFDLTGSTAAARTMREVCGFGTGF